jgi:excisionase family DNA binding protein
MNIDKEKAEYLGVADAEALTSISRWTWRKWAYEGSIASVKLGRRLLIPRSEMDRFIAEHTRPVLSKYRS